MKITSTDVAAALTDVQNRVQFGYRIESIPGEAYDWVEALLAAARTNLPGAGGLPPPEQIAPGAAPVIELTSVEVRS